MEKEQIIRKKRSVTLNVTGGKIDSYRKKEETTGTVRVYRDGCIGVAGCLGKSDAEVLIQKAEEALALGIHYPCALDDQEELCVDTQTDILPEEKLIPAMQDMLDKIGQACPNFAISNKISLQYNHAEYRNSRGRHLTSDGNVLNIGLVFQSRGSGNLMDGFFGYSGKSFRPEYVVDKCKALHDAYYTPVDIEEGEWPVIMEQTDLFGNFLQHFLGEMYASGASLVHGKLGERIFSSKLTLADDRNPETNPGSVFFDAEGQVSPDYRSPLIQNGVLTGLLTTKNTAAQFGLPVSKTSSSAYDGVPSIGMAGLYVAPTAESIGQLVPGKAIYVVMASGGDTTPSGHYATPVQAAYLLENGKLAGRLPELNISGDFFSILGENYMGCVHGDLVENCQFCCTKMKVTK